MNNWYKKAQTQKSQILPYRKLIKRLTAINWDYRMTTDGQHAYLYEPLKQHEPILISLHAYEHDPRTWRNIKGDILKCNPDIAFVFNKQFKIPDNFNIQTQKLEDLKDPNKLPEPIPFHKLPHDILKNKLIYVPTEQKWKKPADIDFATNTIMFEDLKIETFPQSVHIKEFAHNSYNLHKNAQNTPKFKDDDVVQAKFNGARYIGRIIDVEGLETGNLYSISFEGYDELYNQNKPENDELVNWMEKTFQEEELRMISPATNWEEVQERSDTKLNLTRDEEFYYGMNTWDVTEANRILFHKPRSTVKFPVKAVEYQLKSGHVNVTPEIKKLANLDIPLILITTEFKDGDDVELSDFPIDGWHRIAKALDEDVEFLPAYKLDLEETKAIHS